MERVRQNLEELNLKKAEERKVSAGIEGTANPIIDATAYIDAFDRLQNLKFENVKEAVALILQYGKFLYSFY